LLRPFVNGLGDLFNKLALHLVASQKC
jgi:hypothetical protein